MANNHFSCNIYGYSQNPSAGIVNFNTKYGYLNSFPSAGTRFYPAPAGTTAGTFNTVINTVIELFPTGLQSKPTLFYTGADVATLNTAAT